MVPNDLFCSNKPIDEIKQIVITNDINAVDVSNFTPLMNAIYYYYNYNLDDILNIIQFLLDAGADINYKRPSASGFSCYSALHTAVYSDIVFVILLLNKGANTVNDNDIIIFGYDTCITNKSGSIIDILKNFRMYLLWYCAKSVCYGVECNNDIFVLPYCLVVCIVRNMMKK